MGRRVVSRRVVRTRVLGSANPVARWGRESSRTCWDSLGGFFVGLLLFFVAFALPFFAARTEKISRELERLEVVSADQAPAGDGLALLEGKLEAGAVLAPPRGTHAGAIAFRHRSADMETRLETRQETHTEVRNGQDVEVTEEITEEVTDWVEKINVDRFAAEWRVGAVPVDPHRARLDLPWHRVYSSDNGQHRESVEVIERGGSVLLAAEFAGGRIASEPRIYQLTTKSKAELVAALHTGEETGRWGLIIVSIILWTIALNLITGPALILINVIPIKQIGGAMRAAITVLSFLVACVLTATVYTLVKYWWVVALLLAALACIVVLNARNRRPAPDLESEPAA